jgi:hypothetical protein
MKTNIHFLSLLALFLEWELFQTNFVEKIKTHILWSITFFVVENCTVHEIMWKNLVQPGRPRMTTWVLMWIACEVPKSTNTLSEYVVLIAYLLQQLLYWRASVLHNAYTAYFVEVCWRSACYTRCSCAISGFPNWNCLLLFKRFTFRHRASYI